MRAQHPGGLALGFTILVSGDEIAELVKNERDLKPLDRELALALVDDLKSGRVIESKLTEGLHYGFHHSNFSREAIELALKAQSRKPERVLST